MDKRRATAAGNLKYLLNETCLLRYLSEWGCLSQNVVSRVTLVCGRFEVPSFNKFHRPSLVSLFTLRTTATTSRQFWSSSSEVC